MFAQTKNGWILPVSKLVWGGALGFFGGAPKEAFNIKKTVNLKILYHVKQKIWSNTYLTDKFMPLNYDVLESFYRSNCL